MRPIYRISSGGGDVTGKIAERLISISIEDNLSDESDRLEIVLHNPRREMVPPGWGKVIGVALGYRETGLTDLGEWEVTHIEHSEPERVMRIEATAAALPGLLGHRKLSQDGVSIGQIAAQIAARHGLSVAVDEDLAGIVWPHLDQDESDAHLLTRGRPGDRRQLPSDHRVWRQAHPAARVARSTGPKWGDRRLHTLSTPPAPGRPNVEPCPAHPFAHRNRTDARGYARVMRPCFDIESTKLDA